MIKGSDIVNVNLSWLYHMTQALDNAGIKRIFQTCDIRVGEDQLPDLDEFVIVSPMSSWASTQDGLGLLATLQLAVVAKQSPGETMKAFTRIVKIQTDTIEQALYGSERLLVDSMDSPEYALPFRSFDSNGNPTSIINPEGVRYERGTWVDRTPDGQLLQSWTTEITVNVYL